MKLHDEIYGEGSETIFLSQMMPLLGDHFSVLETFHRPLKLYEELKRFRNE